MKVCHGRKEGLPPRLKIELELAVQNATRDLIRAGLLQSAHDCSDGGLAVALAECCFNPNHLLGAQVALERTDLRTDQLLFNETQSRIVISVAPENENATTDFLTRQKIPFQRLGTVGGDTLSIGAKRTNFLVADCGNS